MSSDVMSNPERQVARCQSEHPDIYDAHYDAIAQLKAVNLVTARLGAAPDVSIGGLERNLLKE